MTPPRIPVTAAPVSALPPIRYNGERGLARADARLRTVGYRLRTTRGNAVWLIGQHGPAWGAVRYPNWRAVYDSIRTGKS